MSYQPTLKFIRRFVQEFETKPPLEREKISEWLRCGYLPEFFSRTASDWILIHLSTDDFFLNSFTIDSSELDKYRSKDALELNFPLQNGVASYGYGWSGEQKRYFYEQNYEDGLDKSKMYPLFFYRTFDGYEKAKRSYYDIIQEFIHFADIHWVEDKSAFCSLNDVGDIEEKIVVKDEEEFAAILFVRKELERYLLYRGHFLCRFLELKRAMPEADWRGDEREEQEFKTTADKSAWIRLWPNVPEDLNKSCDLVRATQVVLPAHTLEELEEPKKECATFILHDWKNKRIVEHSCDPDSLDSYFEDTGKPFQTSPVYFKPDVLLKYKMEPERYELRERSIYCRGAWSLQTYDINDEGQVHTYICYLAYLPYREQLHWKQFNEKPKGTISERAFKTDFEAEWTSEYNPLQLIKQHLKSFPPVRTKDGEVIIWKPKEDFESLAGKVHYVTAGKPNEYKEFLMALTILVIDGFQSAVLSSLVKANPKYNEDMKSLGCLKIVLEGLGLTEEASTSIVRPLRVLQDRRSKYGGHGGSKPDFDLIADCRNTLRAVEVSLNGLVGVLNSSSLRSDHIK